jgi:hypothetical protein
LFLLGVAPLILVFADDQSGITQSKDQADTIGQLIQQLGDRDFAKREEASGKLLELGKAALPALERVRESDDAEVRKRAGALTRAIQDRLKERATEEFFAKLNRESVDRFVDRLALSKEPPKEEDWETVVQLADTLADQAFKVSGREWVPPKLNHKDFKTIRDCGEVDAFDQKRICTDGMKKEVGSVTRCILVSGGPIAEIEKLENSIVIVNGDIERLSKISHCIVLCNGNIESVGKAIDCIILATGQVEHCLVADDTFFQVQSVGTHCIANRNVYLNCLARKIATPKDNSLIESNKGPLAKLRFFDPADLGIQFTQFGGHAEIWKTPHGKAFADAGLREEDQVLAVGGTEVATPADCLRALRRKAAVGEDALFKIRRGKETLEFKVRLKD